MKLFFFGTWKNNRWQRKIKLFSRLYQTSKHSGAGVVSTNISINSHCVNGELDIARHLFDGMPNRTVVSWNTIISGYSKWKKYNEALSLVSAMHHSNINLNETTFSIVLSACARSGSLDDGKMVHCLILKSGLQSFKLVGSTLLYFYGTCSLIKDAKQLFDELHGGNELLWSAMLVCYVQCNLLCDALNLFLKMPKRDVVSWTTLISGHAKSEDGCGRALELFSAMRRSNEAVPNEFTFDSVIRACGDCGALTEGKLLHGLVIKFGFEFDDSICGALIEFYCDCEAVHCARRVYDGTANPCLSASNSIIAGLISMDRFEDAEIIFNRLKDKDSVSYNLMIKGYAMSGQAEESKRLFEKMTNRTIISSNIMISVYAGKGEIYKALSIFEETKGERDPITWNSMMSCYVQNYQYEEALKLYTTMCRSSMDQTRSTFSTLFHACSCLGSLELGRSLHAQLTKTPFQSDVYVGTSLIDMYSKCGSISDAETSFSCITSPNVAAWTARINGFAHHGLGSEAILLFEHMLEQGVFPNAATLVGVLCGCGRAGLISEGLKIFNSMEKYYGVIPTLEHYTCVVDLLGRSGNLQEAAQFIDKMPIEADWVIWGALLNACWYWMDMNLGEKVAENMCSFEPKPTSAYVILSNMYAVLGKWGEKREVRRRLMTLLMAKDRGCSWIDLNSRVHVFSVEDKAHPHARAIYATLEHLIANMNFTVQFDSKGASLCH